MFRFVVLLVVLRPVAAGGLGRIKRAVCLSD